MPPPQIADFLQNRDVGRIEEKLRQQKQEVARRQQELARIERKIDNRLRQLREAQTTQLDVIERVDCGPCRLFWLGQTLRIPDTGKTVTALDIDRQYGLVVRRQDGTVVTLRCGEVSVRGLYGYI